MYIEVEQEQIDGIMLRELDVRIADLLKEMKEFKQRRDPEAHHVADYKANKKYVKAFITTRNFHAPHSAWITYKELKEAYL